VRSGETTPLFNHGRSSYGASHRRFQTASFGSGSWYTTERILQEPYHSRPFVVMLRRSLCCFREVRRNYTTLQPWPFELRCKPPTLSSTASFGSGSWYTERILQEPYHSRPFVCDEGSFVLLFVRSGETTPLFNHGRSSYGASHRRFQVLQASVQVAGILLKGSCKSHTIQDLSL
jgi:hypothetical protein